MYIEELFETSKFIIGQETIYDKLLNNGELVADGKVFLSKEAARKAAFSASKKKNERYSVYRLDDKSRNVVQKIQNVVEENYTVSTTGDRTRIGFWYQPSTKKIIDAHRRNHAEAVALSPHEFGISREEISALKKHEDFELDWNTESITLANKHGWVRVVYDGVKPDMELNLQSTNAKDVWLTAKEYVPAFAPTKLFIDTEVRDYNNVWHDCLEGKAIDRYLKTGRIPKLPT